MRRLQPPSAAVALRYDADQCLGRNPPQLHKHNSGVDFTAGTRNLSGEQVMRWREQVAHPEQMEFVRAVRSAFPQAFANKRVLEIGSLDINGSIRSLFSGGDYTGLDVAAGPGVDIVCQGQNYDAPDSSYDTVVCCEVMEHNPYWQETFRNMLRLCKPAGLVLMTCATTGRQEHGTTRTTPADSPLSIGIGWDYYRNLEAHDFRAAADLSDCLSAFAFFSHLGSRDLYFVGFRRGGIRPPHVGIKLLALRWRNYRSNARALLSALKRWLLIAIVGKERYLAGPVRFW
jgi:SAM-dependent methyltransferase